MKIAPYIYLGLLFLFLSSCSSIKIKEQIEINEKEDWLIIGADPERTNISRSNSTLNPPFSLKWSHNLDAGFSNNCLSASDGVLFAATLRGEVFALNIENGKNLGRITNLGKGSFGTPAILGKGIIVTFDGDKKNSVINYNIEEGREIWSRDIGMTKTSPVLFGDMVLLSSIDNKIYSLNKNNGNLLWSFSGAGGTEPKPFYTTPTLNETILVSGNTNGSMYALSTSNGWDLWEFKTGGPIYADASIYDDKIYFGSDDKSFYCLDFSGNVVWKRELNTTFKASPSFYKDMVIIPGVNGNVYALNMNTGDDVWKYQTNGTIYASPVVHNDKIFIGSFDTKFYCLDANNGNRLWNYTTEGRIRTTALIWKDFIFAASEDRNVYCFVSKSSVQ